MAYGKSGAERGVSRDGYSGVPLSPQTAVPSTTHPRLPVRPSRGVGYASGNKKRVMPRSSEPGQGTQSLKRVLRGGLKPVQVPFEPVLGLAKSVDVFHSDVSVRNRASD